MEQQSKLPVVISPDGLIKHQFKYGDGQIVFKTKRGAVQVFSSTIMLRESMGEIVEVQGKAILRKSAYDKMNKICNINIFPYPHTQMIDGVEQKNPFLQIDPVTETPKRFIGNYLGVGYALTGNLMMVTSSLHFDLQTYAQQKLVKMVKDKPSVFKVGIEEFCPFLPNEKPFKGKDGVWKVIDRVNFKTYIFKVLEKGDGVWVDQGHTDYLEYLESSRDRTKFAERIAIGIVKRNILKEFMGAIQVQIVSGRMGDKKDPAVANVIVYGVKHLFDQNDIEEKIQKAFSGNVDDFQVVHAEMKVDDQDVVDAEAEVVEDVETEKKEEDPSAEKNKPNGNEAKNGSSKQTVDDLAEDSTIRTDLRSYAKVKGVVLDKDITKLSGSELKKYRDDFLSKNKNI